MSDPFNSPTLVKSEKTKCRKPLWLGVLSLALVAMPFFVKLFGVFWMLSFLASIVIGILAMITGSSLKSKIGILLGGIGVVFSVLFFLLMSVMTLADINALRSRYLWKMQTLSSAIQHYCKQNEGALPDADVWCDQILESEKKVKGFSTDIFRGDSYIEYGSGTDKKTGFAFNKNLDGCQLSEIARSTVLLFETDSTDSGWNQNGTSAVLTLRGHGGYLPFSGGYYFVFVGPDSIFTVKFIKNSEVNNLNWTPK